MAGLNFQRLKIEIYYSFQYKQKVMRLSGQSGPKYRLVSKGFIQEKVQKAYMKTLQQDVEKSKVAVENITTFTFTQQQLKKQIDDIQLQLRDCVTKIQSEIKKQKIMAELISLLKGEMMKYQTKQKKQEETDNANHQKLVKKINYDIEQILQKYNEKIARISLLKEQASSRRSERVVYSNLFKKLQKQIKYYEEIYKEQLMKSQTAKLKGQQEEKKFPLSKAFQRDKKTHHTIINKSQIKQSVRNIGDSPFITAKDDELNDLPVKRIKQISSITQKQQKSIPNWNPKQQNVTQSTQITKGIDYYINFIEKIKIYTQCSSACQIIEHFSSIQDQSERLMKQIEILNQQLNICRTEEEQVIEKIHQEEFAYRYTLKLIDSPISQQMIQRQKTNKEKEDNINSMFGVLEEIGLILGQNIQFKGQDKKMPSQEQLKAIDGKINSLSTQEKMNVNRSKDETVMSENMVDCLLDKMDKFNDSQKILDRNLFKQEYYKELNKGRRLISRLKK